MKLSFKENTVNVLESKEDYTIEGLDIEEDNQGNIWLIGDKKAFVLSKNGKTYKTVEHSGELNFKSKVPRSLKRKDGSIWIATVDKGIIIANDFTLKTEYLDTSKGLIDNRVWEIEEDSRGEIWLGTPSGINIIDLKENTIKALGPELLHLTRINYSINKIEEISKDIYFIDAAGGFLILNRQKSLITKYRGNSKSPFKLWDIELMNEQFILMTTNVGLLKYDIYNNTLEKITSKNNPDIFIEANQSIIHLDSQENLWLPTLNGLAKINLNSHTISYIRKQQGLCSDDVFVIKKSKEGDLWVATLDGLAILNPEKNTLTNLKEENGLIPDELYDLIEKDNIMYAASVNGLIHIEKSSAKSGNNNFFNFNKGLGFKSNDYLENSPKFLKNGQFWAGVSSPSNEFKLLVMEGAPKPDTITSNIHITNMFVMDEEPGFIPKNTSDSLNTKITSYAITNEMKWDSVTYPYAIPAGLELPYDQNSLSFSYANGDVYNRDKLTYRFILDGEDTDWTFAST
ncbi:MAG: two-component regulator propeller domain-containing protein, partial [Maribacter sp.]